MPRCRPAAPGTAMHRFSDSEPAHASCVVSTLTDSGGAQQPASPTPELHVGGILVTRSAKAAVATLVVLLSTTAVAAAQPAVSVTGNTASFRDDGGSNADALTVTVVTSQVPNTVAYRFVDNAQMLPGPGCVPAGSAATDITCTVPGGTGVSVDLGGAPSSAPQSAT